MNDKRKISVFLFFRYSEIIDYNFKGPNNIGRGSKYVNFVNLVWKGALRVGVGIAVGPSPNDDTDKMMLLVAVYTIGNHFKYYETLKSGETYIDDVEPRKDGCQGTKCKFSSYQRQYSISEKQINLIICNMRRNRTTD